MSPEFYAIIGVGASLAGLMVGIAGVLLYFIIQTNRRIDEQGQRIDRLEDTFTQRVDRLENTFTQRMDRLEDKIDRLLEQTHSLDLRVSKLEWMLDAALHGKPVKFPPEDDADNDSASQVT